MRATIKEKDEVAERTVEVVFDLGGQHFDYRPGQYFWVELPNRGYDDERGLRRHISIVTSPTEHGVIGFATRLRDSAFKKTVAEMEVGDEADVEEPKGTFMLPEETDRPYVFVAGGIGITVFRSMLRYMADMQLPYRVTLLYSNRNRAAAAFLDELEEIRSGLPGLEIVLTMTDEPDWGGETRHIDDRLLHDYLGDDVSGYTFLVAGPPAMVEGVSEQIRAAGVADDHVIAAKFAGY